MKKAFLILLPLLPLIYVLSIAGLFFLDSNDEQLFAVLGCYIFLSLVLTICGCTRTKNTPFIMLARSNVWAAVSNLILFLAEGVYWIISLNQIKIAEANGAMEGGLMLLLLILLYLPHWISYLLTRIAGAVNCVRILRSDSNYMLHALMHLLPVTDLISAIIVLYQVKKQEN